MQVDMSQHKYYMKPDAMEPGWEQTAESSWEESDQNTGGEEWLLARSRYVWRDLIIWENCSKQFQMTRREPLIDCSPTQWWSTPLYQVLRGLHDVEGAQWGLYSSKGSSLAQQVTGRLEWPFSQQRCLISVPVLLQVLAPCWHSS